MATTPALPGRPIRVGLVGFGLGGSTFHAPFITTTPGLALAAVVTSDEGRRSVVRDRHPATAIVPDVTELVHRDDIDLVVVSTPNATHVPIALEALRAGCHVVVDKPIAPSVDEARQLRAVALEHDRLCVPFHNRRWDGDFLTVQDLLRRGRLGPLWRIESRYERWRPLDPGPARAPWKDDPAPGAAGGVLFDLGTHVIDQIHALLGPPVSVYAELATRRPGARADDDAFVALTYADGAEAHLWASLTAGQSLPRFRVIGATATYLKPPGMDPQEAALGAGRSPTEEGWGTEDPIRWGTVGTGDEVDSVPTVPGDHGAFYRGVVAALSDGAPPPVTIDDGLAVLAVVEAAHRSATEHTVIPLRGG